MPKSGRKKTNRGSVVERIKEDVAKMEAASMSRRQDRSNLTSKDLEGKVSGGSATIKEAPNGKEYMGPAFGEYKAKSKEEPKLKQQEKPRQRPGAGREDMMRKMEEERKRRQRGESAVVGS